MSQTRAIVVFKDTAEDYEIQTIVDEIKLQGGRITHNYEALFKGFAAEISDAHFQALKSTVGVWGSIIDSIESDGVVTTYA